MRHFLQRVDLQQPFGREHGLISYSRLQLVIQEPSTGIDRKLVQPRPFVTQEVLEAGVTYPNALKKLASVKRYGRPQSIWRALGHQPHQGSDVDLHGGRVERDRLAFDNQGGGFDFLERLAERPKSLTQTTSGLGVTTIAPQ